MKKEIIILIFSLLLITKNINAFNQQNMVIEGEKIFYLESGTGDKTPIILLHGLGMSSKFWSNNIDKISKERKVFAIDFPGFGNSDKDKKDYSRKYYVKILRTFIIRKKIKKVILIGHSLGGSVCIFYTLGNSDKVEKLILVASEGVNLNKEGALFKKLRLPIWGDMIFVMRDRDMIRDSLKEDFFYNPNLVSEDLVNEANHGSRDAFLLLLRTTPNLTGLLSSIKIPTLIIWGDKDKLYPSANAHIFNEKITKSNLMIFSEAGTCPQIEKSESFNQSVLEFIE